MKKKRLIMLLLQMCLIIGFAFSFYTYVQKEIQPTDVFVFTQDIADLNTEITANHVKRVQVPAKAVTKDFAKDPSDIIGKYLITKSFNGQYVYKSQLVDKENIDPFDSMDLSKLRKISLPINYIDGFAGNIKRGDKIDLVFTGEGTIRNNQGSQEKFNYSKVFMHDIMVYSVNTEDGYKYVDRSKYSLSEIGANEGESIDVDTSSDEIAVLTVAVTLEQAEEIEARIKKGSVRYLGRFDESETYETMGYVIGNYSKVFSGTADAETGAAEVKEDSFQEKISN